MKVIELSSSSPSLQELLQLAGEGNLVLRTQDGREFLVAEIDDDELEHEVALIREQTELMAFLQERSRPAETYSLDEVRQQLGLD